MLNMITINDLVFKSISSLNIFLLVQVETAKLLLVRGEGENEHGRKAILSEPLS